MYEALTKIILISLAIALLCSPIGITTATSSTIQDKSMAIITSIFAIDTSKYQLILNGTSSHYNTSFGPDVLQEAALYTFVSANSSFYIDLAFLNGKLWHSKLYPMLGSPIYNHAPTANALTLCKDAIQNYQTFARQNYDGNISYVNSIASMMNSITELKPMSIVSGNIKLNITTLGTDDNPSSQTLKFIYVENGVDIPQKAVTLKFSNGGLQSIADSWSVLDVGASPDSLSRDEALKIAWEQAQNYTLKFVAENGSIIEVKPDLTNVTTTATLSMTTRNSTALYPLWNINFYFNKFYYGDYGIQVEIWGDTREILLCRALTSLGGQQESSSPNSIYPGSLQSNNFIEALSVATAIGVCIAIFLVVILTKIRKSKK